MAQQIVHPKIENEASLISLSLLIPTWNESATIGRTIIDAKNAIADLADVYEVLVIDDGGRDWTAATIHSISITHPAVRLVPHEPKPATTRTSRTLTGESTITIPAHDAPVDPGWRTAVELATSSTDSAGD